MEKIDTNKVGNFIVTINAADGFMFTDKKEIREVLLDIMMETNETAIDTDRLNKRVESAAYALGIEYDDGFKYLVVSDMGDETHSSYLCSSGDITDLLKLAINISVDMGYAMMFLKSREAHSYDIDNVHTNALCNGLDISYDNTNEGELYYIVVNAVPDRCKFYDGESLTVSPMLRPYGYGVYNLILDRGEAAQDLYKYSFSKLVENTPLLTEALLHNHNELKKRDIRISDIALAIYLERDDSNALHIMHYVGDTIHIASIYNGELQTPSMPTPVALIGTILSSVSRNKVIKLRIEGEQQSNEVENLMSVYNVVREEFHDYNIFTVTPKEDIDGDKLSFMGINLEPMYKLISNTVFKLMTLKRKGV